MFEVIMEYNFDLNAIYNGRGTLLDELDTLKKLI